MHLLRWRGMLFVLLCGGTLLAAPTGCEATLTSLLSQVIMNVVLNALMGGLAV